MQPAPKKQQQRGSPDVKFSFSKQLCRAQSRQQLEVELLEELRSYSKQRACIEKEYGQALQRLAAQYLRKDSSRGKADASDGRTTLGAWRTVVEATAQLGQARSVAANAYRMVSVDAARTSRAAKDLHLKCSEQLVRIQAELMEAVKELNKAKKQYGQRQRVADIAQQKAAEAQAKTKKSEFGIFHTKTSLQKLNAKLSSRLWECNCHVTEARNEYLLTISAVTAHLAQYIHADLPQVLKNLDNDIYERLQEFLTLIGKTETDTSRLGEECFQNVLESSRKISREVDLQLFLQDNPVFSEAIAFTFQPVGTDKICHLELDVETKDGESSLDKEARKWATKQAMHHKVVAHGDRLELQFQLRGGLWIGKTAVALPRPRRSPLPHWLPPTAPALEGEGHYHSAPNQDSRRSAALRQLSFPEKGWNRRIQEGCLARALYGYQGQSAEELCFPEGALIRILHTGEWGVEDRFWQGEFDGRVGVFPSLLVEMLRQDAAEPVADLEKGSPPFSPPPPGSDPEGVAQQEDQATAVQPEPGGRNPST